MVRRIIMRYFLSIVLILLFFCSGCLNKQAEYPSPANVTAFVTGTPEITNEETVMSSFQDLLDGDWSVIDQNAQVVGHLIMDNGQYEFIPLKDNIPQVLYKRLPFIRTTKGEVTCAEVTNNQSTREKILATCVFEDDTEIFQIRIRVDEINNDKTLFFHGGYSEMQLWQVKKALAK